MGKGQQQQQQAQPQVINVQAPGNDIATQTRNELLAAKPLIDLGQAQFNQQLPFTKTALADSLASRFGSVENAGGAGAQTIGNTVGPLAQNLATLQSQNTQIGAQGALQGLSNSIADAQAQAAVRPIMGLYSPTGQDQATANLAGALANSYAPRRAQNQVEGTPDASTQAESPGPPPNWDQNFSRSGGPYGIGTGGFPDVYANPSQANNFLGGKFF